MWVQRKKRLNLVGCSKEVLKGKSNIWNYEIIKGKKSGNNGNIYQMGKVDINYKIFIEKYLQYIK